MVVINFANTSVVVNHIVFFQKYEGGWKVHLSSGHNINLTNEEKDKVFQIIAEI
jgi:hypothetical protein